jgi:hypothetical protein
MKTDDFFKMSSAIARVSEAGIQTGSDLERRLLLPYFDDIFATYRRALGDPAVRIPSPLHVAIANAQRFVGELREGQDEHKLMLGAEAMVREPA